MSRELKEWNYCISEWPLAACTYKSSALQPYNVAPMRLGLQAACTTAQLAASHPLAVQTHQLVARQGGGWRVARNGLQRIRIQLGGCGRKVMQRKGCCTVDMWLASLRSTIKQGLLTILACHSLHMQHTQLWPSCKRTRAQCCGDPSPAPGASASVALIACCSPSSPCTKRVTSSASRRCAVLAT